MEHIIFYGMIKSATIKQQGGFYYLTVEGKSNTFQMDIQKKRRSFQDKIMKFTSMVRNIISDYKSAHVIDTISNDKK